MYLLDTCDNPGTLIMCKTLANVLIRYRPVSLDFIRDRIEEIFVNLGKDIGLRHQFGKSTYTLPKISLRNNIIDSEVSFARFGLAIQNELGEIMKQATRQPPVPVPQPVQTIQEEHNTTPTGVTSDGNAKPRKVGFSNPLHNTEINHRLSALSVDTGSPSPTG